MGGGEVSEMRGNGGEGQNLYGRACREHPTTLTASWWAGYSGREGGGGRGEQRAEPRRKSSGAPPLMRLQTHSILLIGIDWFLYRKLTMLSLKVR